MLPSHYQSCSEGLLYILAHIYSCLFCITKAFLTFFFKQYKVNVGAGAKCKHAHSQVSEAPVPACFDEEFDLEEGEELSPEERERASTLGEDEAPLDGGQAAHDEKAVKTLRGKAVLEMTRRGI